MKIVFRFGRCNIIIYSSIWDVPNERHADPAPQKSGKMEIFVPKDAQYSEIYVKTIFTEILKFYRLRKFEFQVSRIFSTKKNSFGPILFKLGSVCVSSAYVKRRN